MKRTLLVALPLMFGLSAPPAHAQDADELVKRGLEALGGVDKLKSLKSRRLSGQITVSGGAASGTFVSTQQRPNWLRFEADILGNLIVQAYDGHEVWQIQPAIAGGSGVPETMPKEQAEAVVLRSDFDGPLVDYKAKGHKIELLGEEEMEANQVYHLRLTLKQGSDIHYYMDAKTYLVHKTVLTQFNPLTGTRDDFDVLASDYREVDGIRIAHSLETVSQGMSFNHLKIEKVEFNIEADPKSFVRPESQ